MTASAVGFEALDLEAEVVAGPASHLRFRSSIRSATVGRTLPTPPAVRLSDRFDNPVAGVAVAFSASDDGAVSDANTRTDAQGVAQPGSWTLGRRAGIQTLTARALNLTPGVDTVLALAGQPASVRLVAGDSQRTTVNTAVSRPITFRVLDEFGNGAPGVTLVTTAPDAVIAVPSATDSSGLTHLVGWRLGRRIGSYRLTVSTPSGASAVATALADAGPPASLRAVSVTSQPGIRGVAVALPPRARVVDAFENPVSGALVAIRVVRGDGQVTRDRATSDASGEVGIERWTLGVDSDNAIELTIPGSAVSALEFRAQADRLELTSVEAGRLQTCGLTASGTGYCWGSNFYGQLGRGDELAPTARDQVIDSIPRPWPAPVMAARPFRALSVGGWHTCGVHPDGTAACWGLNNYNRLGVWGRTTGRPTVVATSLRFADVVAHFDGTCGREVSGRVSCWGRNNGNGTAFDNNDGPVPIRSELRFASLTAVGTYACGLTSSGTLTCWGGHACTWSGRRILNTPGLIANGMPFQAVALGEAHTCALDRNGQPLCWDWNEFGQLGDGTQVNRSIPTAVRASVTFVALTAGGRHTCGLTSAGEAWCWGDNEHGQLGDGTTGSRTLPVPVDGALRFRTLSAGIWHTCGVTLDGQLACWGWNVAGQLGDGTLETRTRPTVLPATRRR